MKNTLEFKHYDNANGGGCRVYENQSLCKGCTATGCGYDREGTAFGNYLESKYMARILLNRDKLSKVYGYKEYEGKAYLDGGCGFSCMVEVAEIIGLKVERLNIRSKSSNYYTIEDTNI